MHSRVSILEYSLVFGMLGKFYCWRHMRLGCSSVVQVLLLQKNVLRLQDMAAVGKVLLPAICRLHDVRRCQIGLYVVEGGGLQLLWRCVLPVLPI